MAAIVATNDIEGAPKNSEQPAETIPGSARFTNSEEDKELAPDQIPFEQDIPTEEVREDCKFVTIKRMQSLNDDGIYRCKQLN